MSGIVPELRLSDFTGPDPAARERFQADLFAALRRWGFVILADHNVPTALLEKAYGLSASLFQLPKPTKLAGAGSLRGYAPFGKEHARNSQTPDLKEFWQIGREPTPEALAVEPLPANVWPETLPGFRETFSALYEGLDQTGRLLLSALAVPLDLRRTGSRPGSVTAPPSCVCCTIPLCPPTPPRAQCVPPRMRTSTSSPSLSPPGARAYSSWTATEAGSPSRRTPGNSSSTRATCWPA